MEFGEKLSGHPSVWSALWNARDAPSRLEAPWKSSWERAKAIERHITHVDDQHTTAQAYPGHGKLRSISFEVALMIVRDQGEDQISFAGNALRSLEASL